MLNVLKVIKEDFRTRSSNFIKVSLLLILFYFIVSAFISFIYFFISNSKHIFACLKYITQNRMNSKVKFISEIVHVCFFTARNIFTLKYTVPALDLFWMR